MVANRDGGLDDDVEENSSMRIRALQVMIVAGVLVGPAAGIAAPQNAVEAVWVSRQVSFVYQGFTTHYSCDGLRDKVRDMLSKLGARRLLVRTYGCTRTLGVEPFPGVRVSMQVLAPASAHKDRAAPPQLLRTGGTSS